MALVSATDAERARLASGELERWRRFGPYVSERQWGTVREDYSADGNAWDYFPHDHARSRAYRWGEDGLFGWCDERQLVCFALALWNGRDPILKERLFGLTGHEGNHGEDVKELYYYQDGVPSHAYMKALYKYPQAAFPYRQLVEESRRRTRADPEYELLDTGVFEGDRYFDVVLEYAKRAPDDLLVRVTATNRAGEPAELWLLPQLWFRNTWSWGYDDERPEVRLVGPGCARATHRDLGPLHLLFEDGLEPLFCDNDTNPRLFGQAGEGSYKDAFDRCIVHGERQALRADGRGTKLGLLRRATLAPGASASVRLRLCPERPRAPFAGFAELFARRVAEADAFYAPLSAPDPDAALVQRQAWAGLLWSKQHYRYDVSRWLDGDPPHPEPRERRQGRNGEWRHLDNADVLSMPDSWEYPWYASWDLAFHCVALAHVDPALAKEQLVLLTRERYMHPSGQIPAYEWAFGDANPPVHAWGAWRVYKIDRKANGGRGDLDFLERVLHKLLLNFTWWVNRKDAHGHNFFQGGFLGLDNIGVFDRNVQPGNGDHLEQSDGTSWMAMYSLNMLRISLELAQRDPVYQDLATKFFEHFLYIAAAMTDVDQSGISLWDEEDEFFYDVVHHCGGAAHHEVDRVTPLKVRSMVGLIPLFAVEVLEEDLLERAPDFFARMQWFLRHEPRLSGLISHWEVPGKGQRRLLSLLRGHRMKCLLRRMLDEREFLSPYGVRALSRYHAEHPFVLRSDGATHEVRYEPGESRTGMFGGNSNWRGPVWFPVNFLLIESLQRFHHYYSDDFRVECPTGSGTYLSLAQVADELARRLTALFLRDASGRRPALGACDRQQTDPHFKDCLLFHEYFHGDDGHGLGASHQTGWTALVAKLLRPRA